MSKTMEQASRPIQPGGPSARRDGPTPYLLLSLLALVAAGVFLKQFYFNPAVLFNEAQRSLKPQAEQGFDLAALAPQNLTPLGPAQVFNPKDLYHKIDGKADLYLTAGFERLTARRFALAGKPKAWCEVFAYQMASPAAAFAVYSQQRRLQAQPLNLPGVQAYRAGNAICLAGGKLYLEMVAGSLNQDLIKAMTALAASLAKSRVGGGQEPQAAGLFPRKGSKPATLTLHPKGAFGFAGFGPLYTMNFAGGAEGLTAFAARLASPQAAQAARQAYLKFLLENGGKRVAKPDLPAGLDLVDMLGAYEVLFVRGPALAGVHDALDSMAALALARRMARKLEAAP